MTMAAVCRRSGIPSTGYFSDVLSGKRRLHPKHLSGLCRALGLEPSAAAVLGLLLEREHLKVSEVSKRRDIERSLSLQRKMLSLNTGYDAAPLAADLNYHMLVFSAFGLFGGAATREQLAAHFASVEPQRLGAALERLVAMGLVEPVTSETGAAGQVPVFRRREDFVLFGRGPRHFSPTQFLSEAIFAAGRAVRTWYARPEDSLLSSTIITTSRQKLREKLPRLRQLLLELQADLDEEGQGRPDTLVRFNVQIYPEEGS